MFRTHTSTLLGSPAVESDCFFWGCIEHSLALPWFYVTLIGHETQTTTMLQVMDPKIFIELLEQHQKSLQIKKVQLVTPPHINGGSLWQMEKLLEFSYCHDLKLGSFELYKVEGCCFYTTLERDQTLDVASLEKTIVYRRSMLQRRAPTH
ncbi:hypothetical protein GIW41_01980 [Pseudomonas sp. PA-6-1D]|uniref:hypothetical protein n=1 Tax=Pseudomonas TaxID=286 RepID=UPI001EF14B7E|nr:MULTISPECIES: hypothetical protein [Pseudomonas]MCF5140225.1 hypothetical protein [Pseudomonas sp. PA-6-3C]MCF5145408.1 hypothetical protein [Pseudomonas sp. PA-6-3F]MCF5157722.1 hypothetical protein [Pseudomonas sp. PA-6-2E]MCF5174015.1 hypothetical protein [Pseudomonas sp. PA-6-1D]MCF5191872.1 hypothetical protein [Pseudomonas sp. PA-6-1H]